MMRTLCLAAGAALSLAAGAATEIRMLPGEQWWGCATYFGRQMPFTEKSSVAIDLTKSNYYNQYASLLVSDKGRVIWCERQATFGITNGIITVTAPEKVDVLNGGTTLREAFKTASKAYFPPSGKTPNLLFFASPQYNTWIELTYHQNEKDILAYAQSMLDHGFPPGVLMIDDTWQFDYGTWEFDPRRFSDPKGMVAKLHSQGFKVILWVCPWVSMDSPAYRLMARGTDPDTVVRQPVGGLYRDSSGKVASVPWWNGVSAMLDFTDPLGRAWFKKTLDGLVADFGVDGFKLDGGALERYVDGLCPKTPMPTGDQANGFAAFALKYPVCEYRHAWKLGGQPIVERLHDKNHVWSDLHALIPDMIASGLLGHPFVCPDMIGGGNWVSFMPGSPFEPELYIRSAQVHALCGQMQFSASPWRVLDEEGQKIIRDVVATRQRFAPYFLMLAKSSAVTGEPMIRNLEYAFPGKGYGAIHDQFMMGEELMVAPQLEKGATERKVVIPPGTWLADDGTVYEGPKTVSVSTPLSRLPYFTRAN